MLSATVVGVVVGVVVAAVVGTFAWLRGRDNREHLAERVKQSACRHQWEEFNGPGEEVVLITGDRERCVKCGARR